MVSLRRLMRLNLNWLVLMPMVVGGTPVAEVVPDREYSQQNPLYGPNLFFRQRRCILRIFIFQIFFYLHKKFQSRSPRKPGLSENSLTRNKLPKNSLPLGGGSCTAGFYSQKCIPFSPFPLWLLRESLISPLMRPQAGCDHSKNRPILAQN